MARKKASKEKTVAPVELTREFFAEAGAKGGKQRAKKMTSEQRSEAARKASKARWSKKKGK